MIDHGEDEQRECDTSSEDDVLLLKAKETHEAHREHAVDDRRHSGEVGDVDLDEPAEPGVLA